MFKLKKFVIFILTIQPFVMLLDMAFAAPANISLDQFPEADSQPDLVRHVRTEGKVDDSQTQVLSDVQLELDKATAVFVVVTDSWINKLGTGKVFKKKGEIWTKTYTNIPVALGRAGLGWGIGIADFRNMHGAIKSEGDGRSPAGAFRLPQAFGAVRVGNFPFFQISDQTICVDDAESGAYNRIIDMNSKPGDWNSFEKMAIPAYEIGIEVAHNHVTPEPRAGSCIFIHLASKSMSPTAGCTAISKENLKYLISELDSSSLLIQMPKNDLQNLFPYFAD